MENSNVTPLVPKDKNTIEESSLVVLWIVNGVVMIIMF